MSKYLSNLRNLFSEDDQIVFNALKEKKDWINHYFYIVCSLKDNQDIEDIIEQRIRFRSLYVNPEYCVDEDNQKVNEDFSTFKVLYLYNDIPTYLEEDEFIVRLNFNKLTDRDYRMLFANFYPCLDKNEILVKEEDEIISLLKKGMDLYLGDNVIIMANYDLVNSCFSCNVVDQILVNDKLIDGYVIHLRLLAEKKKIELKDNYD